MDILSRAKSVATLSGLLRCLQIGVYSLVGVALGMAPVLTRIANATSYSSDEPRACINCRVEYYFRTDEKAGRKNYLVFPWDFIAASNGMGFHSPQESLRLLGEAANLAQQARVEAARLLARRGITEPPKYPDIATRAQAWDVAQAFVDGRGAGLLP